MNEEQIDQLQDILNDVWMHYDNSDEGFEKIQDLIYEIISSAKHSVE